MHSMHSPTTNLLWWTQDNIASIGVLVPNTECKIVNEQGEALGPDQRGELWIRGPQVMKGWVV